MRFNLFVRSLDDASNRRKTMLRDVDERNANPEPIGLGIGGSGGLLGGLLPSATAVLGLLGDGTAPPATTVESPPSQVTVTQIPTSKIAPSSASIPTPPTSSQIATEPTVPTSASLPPLPLPPPPPPPPPEVVSISSDSSTSAPVQATIPSTAPTLPTSAPEAAVPSVTDSATSTTSVLSSPSISTTVSLSTSDPLASFSSTQSPSTQDSSTQDIAATASAASLSSTLVPSSGFLTFISPTTTSQAQDSLPAITSTGSQADSSGASPSLTISQAQSSQGLSSQKAHVIIIIASSVVGSLLLLTGIVVLIRRTLRRRRLGRAESPPSSPLLDMSMDNQLPLGIARSISQRSHGFNASDAWPFRPDMNRMLNGSRAADDEKLREEEMRSRQLPMAELEATPVLRVNTSASTESGRLKLFPSN